MRSLVLGIGNLLLCDEGVGVHVARLLQQEVLLEDVVILDVGTAFLDALPEIEKADRVIIVDAMQADHAPGSIYRVPFDECVKPECIASLHGFDLSRTLFLAGRDTLPDVVVIGVEPARIDWGVDLSPEVQKMVPSVLDAVKAEIAREQTGAAACSE
ncbi:hydrogenase maturation protease [Geobacter hydrogenophilus]|uniref:Hydrogenase expression/formation protein n=1 Tax=Geobacter hydrogenophilus TaxID=40983 RepID=A0A9W6LA62_9BACT|nr:hydrogenase maturation protease [Geobacter hydrogenophilus]MBT0894995.1 hydrogenase maturation protease [Geobacter hydrogenophilus]GLI37033.1 hydrogenase expression/formation protein [Geobacter hydrogenophilus]